jgi:hypothetical protein
LSIYYFSPGISRKISSIRRFSGSSGLFRKFYHTIPPGVCGAAPSAIFPGNGMNASEIGV